MFLVKILVIYLVLAFNMTFEVDARVLSGSRTEQRILRRSEQLMRTARRHRDAGRVQQALDAYWEVLEINAYEEAAYLELGEMYYNLRIYPRAIELLEPGLEMAAGNVDRDTLCYYYCILTKTHIALNQTGEASRALLKAAEAGPRNPLPRKILGDIYRSNNRINSALQAYAHALRLDPSFLPALERFGELAIKQKNENHIRLALRTYTEHHPTLARSFRNKINEAGITLAPPSARQTAQRQQRIAQKPQQKEQSHLQVTQKPETRKQKPKPIVQQDSSQAILPLGTRQKKAPPATETKPTPKAPATEVHDDDPYALPEIAQTEMDVEPLPTPMGKQPTKPAEPTLTGIQEQDQEESKPPEKPEKKLDATPEEIEQMAYDLWSHEDPDKREEAAKLLVRTGSAGLYEVEELIYSSNPDIRITAVRTLIDFKNHYDHVLHVLNDAIDDPNPDVRSEIEKSIEYINKKSQ